MKGGQAPRSTGLIAVLLATAVAFVGTSTVLAARLIANGGHLRPQARAASRPSGEAGPSPLKVNGFVPEPGSTDVPADSALIVTLSSPLAPDSPMPEISPPMLGTWAQVSPSSLVFTPSGSWVPGTALTMTVPGGTQGIKSTDGRRLAKTVTARFSIALGSELRLEEILATLGYLPLSFTPADPAPVIPREEAEPLLGTFAWRWQSLPAQLTSLWTQGEPNLVTAGAVRTFEDQSGLATDGIAGPEVWTRLLQALAAAKTDPAPYDYVLVTTALPEHLQVWSEGKIVFSSAVNTGIAASPTPRGTWPVYLRFRSTTMQGTNPDGSHYNDPGVPWVSYFHGGDALHGFIRGGYGFPQSLGCVELPYAAAASVWPLTPIGTLVTVT